MRAIAAIAAAVKVREVDVALLVVGFMDGQSDINFADLYRGSYGSNGAHDLPVVKGEKKQSNVFIDQDLILAAPMWHDWANTMVFQWNADGSEFTELNFGGTGANDAW